MEMRKQPLQPSTVLELIDRTFRIYRENFLTFLVPVALVTVPITIINLVGTIIYTQRAQPLLQDLQTSSRSASTAAQAQLLRSSGEILSVAGIYLFVLAITTLLQVVLVQGIITQLASESHLGFRETAGKAFSTIRERLFPLTGAVIVEFIIFFVLICVIAVMTRLLPICGFLFIGLIYVWLAMFSLLPPIFILERTSIGLGIRRAWSLGKARIWQILGLTLVIGIINYAITLGLQSITGLFVQDTASVALSTADIVDLVFQSIITTLISPVIPIAFTLLYYDARVRVEGLDIAFENSGISDPRPADLESPQPTDPLITGKDFGNMVVVGIVLIGLAGLLVCGITLIFGSTLSRFS